MKQMQFSWETAGLLSWDFVLLPCLKPAHVESAKTGPALNGALAAFGQDDLPGDVVTGTRMVRFPAELKLTKLTK